MHFFPNCNYPELYLLQICLCRCMLYHFKIGSYEYTSDFYNFCLYWFNNIFSDYLIWFFTWFENNVFFYEFKHELFVIDSKKITVSAHATHANSTSGQVKRSQRRFSPNSYWKAIILPVEIFRKLPRLWFLTELHRLYRWNYTRAKLCDKKRRESRVKRCWTL